MRTFKIRNIGGVLLDAAVAKALGLNYTVEAFMTNPPRPTACWLLNAEGRVDPSHYEQGPYRPTLDSAFVLDIMHSERIGIEFETDEAGRPDWRARKADDVDWVKMIDQYSDSVSYGRTIHEAVLRTFVCLKFGFDVELKAPC